MYAATSAQEQVTRDFQQTVTLGAGQSVRVEHKFGSVRLHGESGREVKISATIRAQASSHEEAESFAQKIKIEVQQTSEGVRIKTIYPEEKSWFHLSKHSSWSVSYDIGMPSDAPITVRNSFGSVEVTSVRGAADVENGYGTLTVRDAGAGRWVNAFGSIELAGAAGNAVVNDNNGSVQVSDVKGTLEIRNRFGSITTRNTQGAATITGGNGAVVLTDAASASITTSFGSVEARNIRGDVSIHDNNGNIEISTVGGAADITDSFGNVTFTDVHGRVNCTTNNGRVKGSSATGGSVTIRDSFGNVELDAISGAVDAETSNGKITLRDARAPSIATPRLPHRCELPETSARCTGTIATSGLKARTAISRSSLTGETNSRRFALLLSRSLPRAAYVGRKGTPSAAGCSAMAIVKFV